MTQSDIEKLLELYSYQTKMYDLMTADVDTNVEDKEAQQSKITYCKVSTKATKDDEGNSTELTDEEKAAKKDQAQQVLDKIKAQEDIAGADVDSLAKEVDESLSSSTATYSTNEDDEDSSLDAEVMKAAKELTEDGQLASDVIEGSDGYYVEKPMKKTMRFRYGCIRMARGILNSFRDLFAIEYERRTLMPICDPKQLSAQIRKGELQNLYYIYT